MKDELLVLLVPVDLHDEMVDTLMALDSISGFTVQAAGGFSREHSRFSLAEQVEGSRRLSRFEVLHESSARPALLSALAPVAGRERLRYWVVPVIEQGHLGSDGGHPVSVE